MKRITLTISLLLITLVVSAQTLVLEGKVVTETGEAIAYTSITLSTEGEEYNPANTLHQMAVADKGGAFSFKANEGLYTLTFSCVGFENRELDVALTTDTNLGAITLDESAEAIEALTITGNRITREADRYIMTNLSESTIAKGRDSYELLKLAPGVWADNNGGISINGKSGVKLLINEREVRMTGDQLMAYLKAIPAENLQKIEIIPQSGADYDADSASGVIKITLRRQRESGTSGGVGLNSNISTTTPTYTLSPSLNLNHKNGNWNLYGNFSLSQLKYKHNDKAGWMKEQTIYSNGAQINSMTKIEMEKTTGSAMFGAIYDLDDRSSLGIEYNMWFDPAISPEITHSTLDYTLGNITESHTGLYKQFDASENHSLTANYIRTLDDKGSLLKIIADRASTRTEGENLNSDTAITTIGGIAGAPVDSLYRNRSVADYTYYTLTAAVEKRISDLTTISFGAKYTLTDTYSTTDYSYKSGEEWKDLTDYNHLTDYNEHIGALYGIYSTRFLSGASLSAGLRAEYTSIPQLSERYVSLFPHFNASMPLTPTQTVILSASYKRGVRRPSFWTMNPVRQQLSEYSYQVGNPDLKPVFSNEISLSTILFYRYTITLGGYLQDDIISQLSMVDEADPTGRTLKYLHVNLNNLYQYYAQIAIPAQITPWWTMNANMLAVMLDQKITSLDANDRTYTLQGYMLNSFSLPQEWSIDVSGNFTTDAKVGNLVQKGSGNISLAVKKLCWDKRLTLSLGVNNILPRTSHISSYGDGFTKSIASYNQWIRSINIGIRYNFQAGKMFRARSVESGAAEEKSRMSN